MKLIRLKTFDIFYILLYVKNDTMVFLTTDILNLFKIS